MVHVCLPFHNRRENSSSKRLCQEAFPRGLDNSESSIREIQGMTDKKLFTFLLFCFSILFLSLFLKTFSSPILYHPDFYQLYDFINSDDIDQYEYDDQSFDCTEFSNLFVKRFADKGFFSCTAELNLISNNESFGHIIVAVYTLDKGLFYVEPQNDMVISDKDLSLNSNYCDLVNWNCNWTIKKVSSCFGVFY